MVDKNSYLDVSSTIHFPHSMSNVLSPMFVRNRQKLSYIGTFTYDHAYIKNEQMGKAVFLLIDLKP